MAGNAVVMVAPAAGPAVAAPLPAFVRNNNSRFLEFVINKKGASDVYKLSLRGVTTRDYRTFDVDHDMTKEFAQRFFNFSNVMERENEAVRRNLATLNQGFNPANHQIDVFGAVSSWGPSGNPNDIHGPRLNLSMGTAQRLHLLRRPLALWQRLYEVDDTTLPSSLDSPNPRKKNLVKVGIFQSFLPVELTDKSWGSIYNTLQQIRKNNI